MTPDLYPFDDPKDNLAIKYLGMDIMVGDYEVLVMAPPSIEEIGGIILTDHSKSSMKYKSNLGKILKIGSHAFLKVDKNNIPLEEQPEPLFKVGDMVLFEDFHPQARKFNGVVCYITSDTHQIGKIPNEELHYWDHYLLFEKGLKFLEETAKEWRSSSLQERREKACTIYID